MRRTTALAVLFALLACACGGGGADVAGVRFERASYWFASMRHSGSTVTESGTMTSLDRELVSFQIRSNNGGTLMPDHFDTQAYHLFDDGSLRFVREPDSADIAASGGVSADGALALAAGIVIDDSVNLGVWVAKPEAPFDPASVLGTYHHVWMEDDPQGVVSAAIGTSIFDDQGMLVRGDVMMQTDQPQCAILGPLRYVVDTTGKLAVKPGTFPSIGGFNQDGSIGLAAGELADGGDNILHLFVRKGDGTSLATLSGAYWIVTLMREGTGYRSAHGLVTLDGLGSGEVVTDSTNGTTDDPNEAGAVTYTVGGVGEVEMDLYTGQLQMRGGVSVDGRIAILAGSFAPGAPPAIAILIRR